MANDPWITPYSIKIMDNFLDQEYYSFLNEIKRVWVHTCSLDHKNALNNYIARGMKVFKKETISI